MSRTRLEWKKLIIESCMKGVDRYMLDVTSYVVDELGGGDERVSVLDLGYGKFSVRVLEKGRAPMAFVVKVV